MLFNKTLTLPSAAEALPGRSAPIATAARHEVLGTSLHGPHPDGAEIAYFGMGCFWGAERLFWQLGPGIYTTAVGYAGGVTPNPTYEETCTGRTGHAEAVELEYDPATVSYDQLLDIFWANHNPTTLNRQGPDVGTQYRSAIYFHDASQEQAAHASKEKWQAQFSKPIVTEIAPATQFWIAEDYHQQYLEKRGLAHCHVG